MVCVHGTGKPRCPGAVVAVIWVACGMTSAVLFVPVFVLSTFSQGSVLFSLPPFLPRWIKEGFVVGIRFCLLSSGGGGAAHESSVHFPTSQTSQGRQSRTKKPNRREPWGKASFTQVSWRAWKKDSIWEGLRELKSDGVKLERSIQADSLHFNEDPAWAVLTVTFEMQHPLGSFSFSLWRLPFFNLILNHLPS